MNKNNEIKKIESLLEQGVITEDEFQILKEEIETTNEDTESNERNESDLVIENNKLNKEETKFKKNNNIDKEKLVNSENTLADDEQIVPKIDLLTDISRSPRNIINAGLNIENAVNKQFLFLFFNTLGVILIIFSVIVSFSSMMRGNNSFSVNPLMLLGAFFIILGFIFWIISLNKFSKAGLLLKTSESLFYDRKSLKIKPDLRLKTSSGLNVGQDFAGGIVAYFDKTGKYVGIVTKDDISGEKNQESAILACKELTENGYYDWYLPDSEELSAIYKNLKVEGIGNFKNELYWNSDKYKSEINFSNGESYDRRFSEQMISQIRPLRLIKIV